MAANYVEIKIRADNTATPDLAGLRAQLDELNRKVAETKVKVDDNQATAKLLDINARLARLNRQLANPKITVEGAARAEATIARLQEQLNRLNDTSSTKRFNFGQGATGILGAIQKGLAAILNMGPVAVPILAAIAGAVLLIVSYLSSLISTLAAAGIGIGAFGAFALPTFQKILAGISAVSGAATEAARNKAWAAIPDALRPVVQLALNAKDSFGQMVKAMQPQVVRIFTDALKGINHMLPVILPIARSVGTAIEGLLKGFDRFSRSQGFKQFMGSMQQMAGPAITAIGQGLGQIAIALGKFLETAASPQGLALLKVLLKGVVLAIDGITLAIKGAQTGARVFMNVMLSVAGKVLTAVKAITDGFLTAVGTIARVASFIPGPWQSAMRKVADWTDRAKTSADNFFANTQAGITNLASRINSTDAVFHMQGNIIDLQNKVAAAKRLLNDPNLTRTRRARITADISQAQSQIAAIRMALNAINGSVATTYVQTVPIGGGKYLTHAAGGIVGAATGGIQAGLRMVGEHGRELVKLPAGSQVFSNPDTERMMAQGGGYGGRPIQLVIQAGQGNGTGSLDALFMTWLQRTVRIMGGDPAMFQRKVAFR